MYYKSLYRKSFIKPPGGGGGYFFKPTCGGLIETELIWDRGALLQLEKMMVSVLHKELKYKVVKVKYKKVKHHAAEDQNQIRTSSW